MIMNLNGLIPLSLAMETSCSLSRSRSWFKKTLRLFCRHFDSRYMVAKTYETDNIHPQLENLIVDTVQLEKFLNEVAV